MIKEANIIELTTIMTLDLSSSYILTFLSKDKASELTNNPVTAWPMMKELLFWKDETPLTYCERWRLSLLCCSGPAVHILQQMQSQN